MGKMAIYMFYLDNGHTCLPHEDSYIIKMTNKFRLIKGTFKMFEI